MRIWTLAPRFVEVLEAAGLTYEIVVVVDVEIHGSLADLTAVLPHIVVLDRPQTTSDDSLIREGLAAARGQCVAVFNMALSGDPAGVVALVECCRTSWDLAVGVRHIGRESLRGYSTAARSDRAFRTLVNQAIDPAFDGNRAGILVLSRDALDATLPHLRSDDSIFDIEILAVARRVFFRRHAYQLVEFQGFATAVPESTLARSMRAATLLAVRLRCAIELRRVACPPDQRPRTERISERRTHHLIGIALQMVTVGTPTAVAVPRLIDAAHGRLELLETAAAICSHDDRRDNGACWSAAEPLLRRAANHLRFDDLPSAAARL